MRTMPGVAMALSVMPFYLLFPFQGQGGKYTEFKVEEHGNMAYTIMSM